MTRISSIVLLALCLQLSNGYHSSHPSQRSPPHIIVIMADDLGWNDVGFHGSNQIPTPNIDALGYNGIILNRHYTLPSCTPSRAAFLSGMYPIRLRMQGDSIHGGEPRGLPLDIRILPHYLRELGYATQLIGKWHVGFNTPHHTPRHRGFDRFFGFFNSHVNYYDFFYSHGNMSGYDMHRGDDPAYGFQDEYATDLFTKEAMNVIINHDPDRPLFLQISHLAVHAPLHKVPREDYYEDREFNHIREDSRRRYAKMVHRLDESVGRVVAALGERGMLKDSIIVFLTDNGAPTIGQDRNHGSNHPLRGTKYTLFEGGVRGVAAIWSPSFQHNARVSNKLFHITDWLPTLYAAAGGNLNDLGPIDGINQWQLLSSSHGPGRDRLLININEVSRTEGAIIGDYKFIRASSYDNPYDGYHGDTGRSREDPLYNTTRVMRSAVSDSIQRSLGRPITQPSRMIQLRQEASVSCHANHSYFNHHTYRANCSDTDCLFDIVKDPCEFNNIIRDYPRIVRDLEHMMEGYGIALKKQVNFPIDMGADPRRHNETWRPWMHSDQLMYAYHSAASSISAVAIYAHLAMASLFVVVKMII